MGWLSCVAGTKQQVGWVKHYLVAVTKGQASSLSSGGPLLQVYDLRNKLIAASVPLKEVSGTQGTARTYNRLPLACAHV